MKRIDLWLEEPLAERLRGKANRAAWVAALVERAVETGEIPPLETTRVPVTLADEVVDAAGRFGKPGRVITHLAGEALRAEERESRMEWWVPGSVLDPLGPDDDLHSLVHGAIVDEVGRRTRGQGGSLRRVQVAVDPDLLRLLTKSLEDGEDPSAVIGAALARLDPLQEWAQREGFREYRDKHPDDDAL